MEYKTFIVLKLHYFLCHERVSVVMGCCGASGSEHLVPLGLFTLVDVMTAVGGFLLQTPAALLQSKYRAAAFNEKPNQVVS